MPPVQRKFVSNSHPAQHCSMGPMGNPQSIRHQKVVRELIAEK